MLKKLILTFIVALQLCPNNALAMQQQEAPQQQQQKPKPTPTQNTPAQQAEQDITTQQEAPQTTTHQQEEVKAQEQTDTHTCILVHAPCTHCGCPGCLNPCGSCPIIWVCVICNSPYIVSDRNEAWEIIQNMTPEERSQAQDKMNEHRNKQRNGR